MFTIVKKSRIKILVKFTHAKLNTMVRNLSHNKLDKHYQQQHVQLMYGHK